MIVKKLRLQKCWSQEQLSQFSGLSVRTIQRIERGQQASLESLKSLAAVFQVNLNDLQMENTMNPSTSQNADSSTNNTQTVLLNNEEQKAMQYVECIKNFYQHLLTYVLVISALTIINFIVSPQYFWAVWPAMGWGIGVVSHGIRAFELFSLFSPEWEKKQIEKRLGREL
jgi:transcriptional regulator with XRE-family HTH domain